MDRALEQARVGRLHILDEMAKAIDKPRSEVSQYAPKMTSIQINPDRIKDIIGPGGKTIKAIQAETETRLEVEDSGKVNIYAPHDDAAQAAVKAIKRLTQEPEVDQVYLGKVVQGDGLRRLCGNTARYGRIGAYFPTCQRTRPAGHRCGERGAMKSWSRSLASTNRAKSACRGKPFWNRTKAPTPSRKSVSSRPSAICEGRVVNGTTRKQVVYNRTELDNRLRIVTERIPHVKSVALGIWVNVGSRDEESGEEGISHLIEHMIFKGTARRNALQIAKEIDQVGGMSNAFTSKEFTCFHAKVMSDHLPMVTDLLTDIFLSSLFNAEDLERERQVILQEIKMVEDTPDEMVHVLFSQNLWPDNPVGRPVMGTRESVSAISQRDIRDYLLRTYIPPKIVISAAGDVDHQQVVDLMGPAFSELSAGERLRPRCRQKRREAYSCPTRAWSRFIFVWGLDSRAFCPISGTPRPY